MWSPGLDRDAMGLFLDHAPRYAEALEGYVPRDNSMLYACIDELLARIHNGEPSPDRVLAEAMGKYSP